MNTSEKTAALKALEEEIAAAELPLKDSANLVFGEGNVDAAVLFIGEAPGFNEDVQRRPFVGRGGQLLNQQIESIGWKRADVYITNIVKRRPPENRDPLPAEIEAYKPYLARQIEIISPKIIVPLGRFSMNYFLPQAKISRDQGRAILLPTTDGRKDSERIIIYPIFHPAAALRNPEMMKEFVASFKKLPGVVSGDFGAIENPSTVGRTMNNNSEAEAIVSRINAQTAERNAKLAKKNSEKSMGKNEDATNPPQSSLF